MNNRMSFKRFDTIIELTNYLNSWGEIIKENIVVIPNGNIHERHWFRVGKKNNPKKQRTLHEIITAEYNEEINILYEVLGKRGLVEFETLKDVVSYCNLCIDCDNYENYDDYTEEKEDFLIKTISFPVISNTFELEGYMIENEYIFFDDIIVLRKGDFSNYSRLRIGRNNHITDRNINNNENEDNAYYYYDEDTYRSFSNLKEFTKSILDNYII